MNNFNDYSLEEWDALNYYWRAHRKFSTVDYRDASVIDDMLFEESIREGFPDGKYEATLPGILVPKEKVDYIWKYCEGRLARTNRGDTRLLCFDIAQKDYEEHGSPMPQHRRGDLLVDLIGLSRGCFEYTENWGSVATLVF